MSSHSALERAAQNSVVIAPDKFKGSLSAAQVAAHVAAGLRRAGVTGPVVELPVADGGDGTVDAAVAAGYQRQCVVVSGPAGQPVTAAFAMRSETAVVEAAQACGLSLLSSATGGKLAPLTATSRGVGELILAAARAGARRIVLGLGGVATNDGGAGMAQALGVRLLDASGRELGPGGAALSSLAKIDRASIATSISDLSDISFLVASDVDNRLLGAAGAAAVYGPQKGASPEDVAVLDAALTHWADISEEALGAQSRDAEEPPGGYARTRAAGESIGGYRGEVDQALGGDAREAADAAGPRAAVRDAPGAGAAGGLGFATLLFLHARLRPGIELLLEMLSFPSHLDGARLVITGEGSLDAQSLHGKAPVGVARAAAAHEPPIPVVTVSGVCSLTSAELNAAGIAAAYALTDIEPDVSRCLTHAGPLTDELAARIADDWLR